MLREALQRLDLSWEFAREVASDVFARPVHSMNDLSGQQIKELRRLFPAVPRRRDPFQP